MRFYLFITTLLIQSSVWAYVVQKDIVYDTVNGSPLKLDIYRPNLSITTAPVLFYIHGGCFNAGSKNDIPESTKLMADSGFVVVSIGYRLSKVAKYPAALNDVQTAVRYIRKNYLTYRINPNRMASFGLSAGGYLAAALGVRPLPDRNGRYDQFSERVQRVADWYGRTDFTLPQDEGFDCAVDFLGLPRNQNTMKHFQEASILPYVDAKSADFYIVHGTEDRQVFPIHSESLHQELARERQSTHLLWVTGAGHGFVGGKAWEKTKEFLLQLTN